MPIPCSSNPIGASATYTLCPNVDEYASSWQCNGIVFTASRTATSSTLGIPVVSITRNGKEEAITRKPRLQSITLTLTSGASGGTTTNVRLGIVDADGVLLGMSDNGFPGSKAATNRWQFSKVPPLEVEEPYRAVFIKESVARDLKAGDEITSAELQRVKLGQRGVANFGAANLTTTQDNLNFLGNNTRLTLDIVGSNQYMPRAIITYTKY